MQLTKKAYYSIREVCERTGLEPHVLRYWESEFPHLRPKKNRAGNRAYRDKDIEVVEFIRYLLYQEQYTISGAKKRLTEAKKSEHGLRIPPPPDPHQQQSGETGESADSAAAESNPSTRTAGQSGRATAETIAGLKEILSLLRSGSRPGQ